jgi:transposase
VRRSAEEATDFVRYGTRMDETLNGISGTPGPKKPLSNWEFTTKSRPRASRGEAIARLKRGYEWTYVYGFVRPESGEVYWLVLPTANVELFSMALAEFAKEVGAGEEVRILLVVDKAGWHIGGEVEIPEGIHLEFLPSGSPELMPAERLWPLTNEGVANRLFEEIEELEEALVERCVQLLDQPEAIRELTSYHWWPAAA